MKFTDLKIRTWLALSFGVIVLLSLLTGGLALRQLAKIEANLESVVKVDGEKIKLNSQMLEATHAISHALHASLLLEDKAAIDAELARLAQGRAAYGQAWEALQKIPPGPGAAEVRARIGQAAGQALAVLDQVAALAAGGDRAQAVALMVSQASAAQARWRAAIEDNTRLQEQSSLQELAASQAEDQTARAVVAGVSALNLLVALVLAMFITRSLTRALGAEPGQAAAVARQVAGGDLSTTIRVESGDDGSLMAQLKLMQDSLVRVVADVRRNAEGVATASAEIAQGNSDLSSRTEQQASSLQETAASMQQLSGTVRQNADSARKGNQLALNASEVASKGGAVVGEVVATMRGIHDASQRIADIIGVIDGIAFQTNILALNAAVEAARAGEQGRGFAVVASEVRSLAQRSAEAAKEIKSLIDDNVQRVEQGTSLADHAGATMNEVVTAIRLVTDLMGEISEASSQQNAGVSQVSQAVMHMDQATQQNAALVEQSAAAAESLRAQAQQLVQSVAVFKLGLAGGPAARAMAPPRPTAAMGSSTHAAHAPAREASAEAVQELVPAPTRWQKPPAPTYPAIERRSAARAPDEAHAGAADRRARDPQAAPPAPSAPSAPPAAAPPTPRTAPGATPADDGDWETF
jgi:methyl-accepting chemotaxis protein